MLFLHTHDLFARIRIMKLKNLLLVFLLSLLVLLSLFPRSIEVLNGNPVFGIDQGRDYIFVKNIVVEHKLTLIGAELGAGQAGLSYLFHGPGYFYLLAIPFIIFDGNPIGGVFLMLILGLATIAFSVYFTAKFLGWKEGLLMGFLMALCPYLIGQSRFVENHFGTPLFILIVFYFTYLFTKTKKTRFIFLSALFSAFIYNLEVAIAVPLCITLFIYCIFLYKKSFMHKLPYLLCGFLISFSPMLLFELRHGLMGLRSLFSYLFIRHETNASSTPIFIHAKNISDLFIYTFSDSFPGRLLLSQNMQNILMLCFTVLIIFIFFKEKDKIKKGFLVFLILLFPVNFLVFMPLRTIVFQHYLTDLVLAILILLTYCLAWLYKNGYFKLATGITTYLAILFAVGIYSAYNTSIHDYYDHGGLHKLRGKIDAIDFIYKDANKKPFGLLVFSPTVYTYPYDYLVWWYGQRKYNYIPNTEKKGTFYLLIEKDSMKPWTYKGWEETVIKTGKVVYTKTLPSGFIVEKRTSAN